MKKQKINFDIIHHITFVNDWMPSFYFLLKTKNSKFIWGPNGSNDPIDFKFLDNKKLKVQEIITNSLKLFFRNIDPFFQICKSKADCIIGINKNVKHKLSLTNKRFISEPAIAIKEEDIENKAYVEDIKDEEFIIISVGRLVHIKNFKLTILSFAKFLKNNKQITNVKLQIIGDGPDEKKLIELTKELEIETSVVFTGKISLDEVQDKFSQANLFLFPTLENAGFVTIEAMAKALPVLAMKYGGPEQFVISNRDKQLVDSTLSYDELIQDFSEKIKYFYANPSLSEEIGTQNKLDVLNNFTWEAKAKKMVNLYKELLDEKN